MSHALCTLVVHHKGLLWMIVGFYPLSLRAKDINIQPPWFSYYIHFQVGTSVVRCGTKPEQTVLYSSDPVLNQNGLVCTVPV